MVEAAPAAAPPVPAPSTKPSSKRLKKVVSSSKACQPVGPGVARLITKAVSASKEHKGLSLAALKKVLASGGYDVEKINIHIRLGLKRLVSSGTLVRTKGTGSSSSFKLNKKLYETKEKAKKKKLAAKPKKPVARMPTSAAKQVEVVKKKSPKKVKKPAATVAKKVAKSPRKEARRPNKAIKSPKKVAKTSKKAAKAPKKAAKSLAKVKAVKPKGAKLKAAISIAVKANKAVTKKKMIERN